MQATPRLSVCRTRLEDEFSTLCDLEDAKLVIFAPWETHLVYYVFLPSGRSKNGQLNGCQLKLKRFKVQTLSVKSENVRKENKTIYRIGYSTET